MSKFLNLVENNLPPQDLDKNREVIQELQRLFASKGITSTPKTFKDIITITIGGKTVDLELKHVSERIGEEDEDVVASVIGMDPKKLTKNPPMAKAKKDIETGITNMANTLKASATNRTQY
jgi:formate-dependent nitrite reductase cytochrome c552 subunit